MGWLAAYSYGPLSAATDIYMAMVSRGYDGEVHARASSGGSTHSMDSFGRLFGPACRFLGLAFLVWG